MGVLIDPLNRLAFYNDKGVVYSRHTEDQAAAKRSDALARIRKLADEVREGQIPPEFLAALASGAIASDLEGRYLLLIQRHFRQ